MSATHDSALIAFVSEELLLRDGGDRITPDQELLISGLLDSIGVMRLVGFIESDLDILVPPDDVTLENFSSVSSILAYLDARSA